MEERYVLGSLSGELYEKYRSKFEGEIKPFEAKLAQAGFESSNLEKAVEKALTIAQNLSGAWVAAGYEGKQKLQYLVFPEGMRYDKENGTVQTERINTLFGAIPPPERLSEDNERGDSEKNRPKSNQVIRIGFKPMTYCLAYHYSFHCLTHLQG